MALPNRLRGNRLARDTEAVINQTAGERANRPAQQAAAPVNTKPDYTKNNVEAVNYGDNRYSLNPNVNRVVSPANPGRRYFFVMNAGANPMTVSFGKPASAISGVPIPANGFYEPLVPPAGSVNCFSTIGSEVVVVEG
jgi:hypothetical protein